jgi:CheY-like chemotaxis protein
MIAVIARSSSADGGHMSRILCVDDEPHVVALKVAILEAAGHDTAKAFSTHEGIELLKQNTYDLIITGWHNGDATGAGVIRRAKEKGLPVIVISGYAGEAREQADPAADLYLEKPVNPEEMVMLVEKLLQSRSAT